MGAYKKAGIWVSVLTPLLLLAFTAVHTTKASAAITSAVAAYKKSTIVGVETACTNRLNSLNARGGAAPRTIVNEDQPYTPITWISPRSSPTGTVVVSTGSSAPIPLQLNDFEFLCAIVVKNNRNSSRITDSASPVTNTRFPNDRPPTANDGNINAASLWNVNTHVNSGTVLSGGGTVSGFSAGNYLPANRDNNSRYWGASPVGFSYNPGSAILTNRTVTVRLNVTSINTYNAPPGSGISECSQKNNPANVIQVSPTQFASCQPNNIDLTFVVTTHGPNIVMTSGASCTVISGRARDPDDVNAQVAIHIYEDGTLRWIGNTSGTTHAFSVPTATVIGSSGGSVDWARHTFDVRGVGVNGAGVPDGANSVVTIQVGPCGQISCNSSMTDFDASGGPGSTTNFQVWVKVAGAKTLPPTNSFAISATAPTTPTPTTTRFAPRAGYLSDPATIKSILPKIPYNITAAGTYTVSWTYSYGSSSKTCTSNSKIGYHPFFQVQGGDIMAGTGFGDCGGNEVAADIKSWNNDTTSAPNYFGAGSAIGAWATGDITNFVSGMGLTGGAAANGGHGLSFANYNNAETDTAPNYGGKFGDNSLPCTHDYYGDHDADDPSDYPGSLDTLGSGNYDADGTATPVVLGTGAPITIDAGTTIKLYVKGNVFIGSNIVYGKYNLTNVPSFSLYVEGNIYISPNVNELHGVYIAQEDSGDDTTGIITTCAESVTSTTEPYSVCAQKQLTVVGAMAAESELRLNRTQGSLSAASDPAAPGGNVPATPAEIFQYSPELWLTTPPTSQLQLKSYTSLPPVL